MENSFFNKTIIEQQKLVAYACDLETYEIFYMTKAAEEMCGVEEQDVCGQKCYQLIQGLDEPCTFCTNSKLAEGEIYSWEHFNEKLQKWVSIDDTLIKYENKLCRLEIARDITAQKNELDHVSNRLTVEETLVECIQTLSGEGDVSAAMHRFLEMIGKYYAAERAYIFEFDFENEIIYNTFEWCAPGVSAQIDQLQNIPLEYIQDWNDKFEHQGEFFITSLKNELPKDSAEYRILKAQEIESLSAAPLKKDNQIIGFLGVDNPTENTGDLSLLRNVSSFVLDEMERRRLIQELERSSYTDMLTGLKNRNGYINRLNALSAQTPDTLGVIFIDINGMKKLNDYYGHEYGDNVIKKVADILKSHVEDACFRVGGDEFVVLCENIDQETFQHLTTELRNDFDLEQNCDVSIGSTWKENGVSVNEEILLADDLMYAEKQEYYRSVLYHGRTVRTGMATEVLQEIADNHFVVYLQPQVDLGTGMIVGAEALVRKQDKDGYLLLPNKFISFYEQEGVIGHVDMHVLDTICSILQQWKKEGIETNISTNFSRVSLMAPDIVKQIKQTCQRYGVPTEKITIEITESISKMDHEQLLELVKLFVAEGFSIALDDFGSEYSNLSILTALDFDEVKFDKSLTDRLEISGKSRTVMKYALEICTELSATRSLAEGIETKRQLELLRQYHCDYGQGYYFAKPMHVEDFYKLLKEEKQRGVPVLGDWK